MIIDEGIGRFWPPFFKALSIDKALQKDYLETLETCFPLVMANQPTPPHLPPPEIRV